MSLEAAARRCRVVEHRGRRYLVSPPTLATVLLAEALFAQEIAAFAHGAVQQPVLISENDAIRRGSIETIVSDTSDGAAGEVLETCCALMGGERGDVLVQVTNDHTLAVALGVAVLSLCDVPRCFTAAGWQKIGKTPIEHLEDERPDGWVNPGDRMLELGVVALAERHASSPMDILAWPFEVVLMVNEASAILHDPKARSDAFDSAREFPLGLGIFKDLGIGYEKQG